MSNEVSLICYGYSYEGEEYITQGIEDEDTVAIYEQRNFLDEAGNVTGMHIRYFILADHKGRFYNPKNYKYSYTSPADKEKWQFRTVNKECFESYLRFLVTHSESHLSMAERKRRDT